MARRIRIPGIVDILRVSTPDEIRMLTDDPRIDRRFVARGPLVNRLVVARIRNWFHVKGQPLPSLAARDDAVRAERQRALANELDPAARPLWSDEEIERLVHFVRSVPRDGRPDSDEAAVVVQEIIGRLFAPDYTADRASVAAAETIDRFRDGFSPVEILWRLTGRLRRARRLLLARARDDRWAMHGTAIGMHGVVRALERMQALRAARDAASLRDEAVLARCLAPPRQVPRVADTDMSTPASGRRLRPGTLVMLRLADAGPAVPGGEMVFMQGRWNGCPAQAFVTGLLKTVWRRSF